MDNTPDGLSPLAAYEELMHFAKKRGEAVLRLALHAAVPQGIQSELLHLLKRNFIPEAGDDPTIEVDVLFSPLCEDLGRGYFRFDPQVRTLLLDNLAANYSSERVPRIYRVANFLLSYVEHFDRNTAEGQDQLWRDYLEIQRWVALAFVDPESAAGQLAAELERADTGQNFAARVQLGGLASALEAPLVSYRQLLNYAAGLQALELGDRQKADEFFESLKDDQIKVGNTTLRPASKIIDDWQKRNPDSRPRPPVEPAVEEKTEPILQTTKLDGTGDAIGALQSEDSNARRQAAEVLGKPGAPEEVVTALIKALQDADSEVRQAAVIALGQVGNEAAARRLLEATQDVENAVRRKATEVLRQFGRGVVLILGRFLSRRQPVLSAIREALQRRNYVPVFFDFYGSTEAANRIARHARFVIADISDPRPVRSQLEAILPRLSIPVQPILQGRNRIYSAFSELQKYSSLLKPFRYDGIDDLISALDEKIIPSVEAWIEGTGGGREPAAIAEAAAVAEKSGSLVFEYDVYISFATPDDHPQPEEGYAGGWSWVTAFVERLELHLRQHLGYQPRIFLDRSRVLRDDWNQQLTQAIRQSAVFVPIVSTGYVKSPWCARELEMFSAMAAGARAPVLGDRSRILKVLKEPVSVDEQPVGLKQLRGYEFFEPGMGGTREFREGMGADMEQRYVEKLERLASDIARMLIDLKEEPPTQPPEVPDEAPAPAPASTLINVFVSYAHKEQRYGDVLSQNLRSLEREGLTTTFQAPITPGMKMSREIEQALNNADVILLLVSVDYLATDFAWGAEVKRAVARAEAGEASVIPIILRPARWNDAPFGALQALPRNGKPLATWVNRDQAYLDVLGGIRKVVLELRSSRAPTQRHDKKAGSKIDRMPATERWPVRTGADKDVTKVNPNVVKTTIEELVAQRRPRDMPLKGALVLKYQAQRAGPVETTIWSVESTIVGYKHNLSGNYRLTLQGAKGQTLIAQVPDPDPKFVKPSSPWLEAFASARRKLSERFDFQSAYVSTDVPARISGVGFFNRYHGQIGVAPNAIELHPILSVEWLSADIAPSFSSVERLPSSSRRSSRTGKLSRNRSRLSKKKKGAKKSSAKKTLKKR